MEYKGLIREGGQHDDEIYLFHRWCGQLGWEGRHCCSHWRLLKERGFNVTAQKLDPYINVDPGTMSPYQHGEVYVLDDGAETDLDLGHYERFIDSSLEQGVQFHQRAGLCRGDC